MLILFFPGHESFSVGMSLRDQEGTFVGSKCISLPRPATVMEAECIGQGSAVMDNGAARQKGHDRNGLVASSSSSEWKTVNLLEVGHVIDHCRLMLRGLSSVSLCHVRKQANKVAHSLSRVPCSLNCSLVFSSPHTYLVEIILNDLMK